MIVGSEWQPSTNIVTFMFLLLSPLVFVTGRDIIIAGES